MSHSKRSCSGSLPTDGYIDPELLDILNALFCCCIEELQTSEALLHRDLFCLTEINGQSLPAAARALGLGIEDAGAMLAKTRRDMAVLMVLGLCKPAGAGSTGDAQFHNCSCRSS